MSVRIRAQSDDQDWKWRVQMDDILLFREILPTLKIIF